MRHKKSASRKCHLIITLWLLSLAACQLQTPLEELTEQQQQWEIQNIDSYELVITHYDYSAGCQLRTLHIRVENSELIDHAIIEPTAANDSCHDGRYDPEIYRPAGLFEQAKNYLQDHDPDFNYAKDTIVVYDELFGFPKSITYYSRTVTDSDFFYEVGSFTVLAPTSQ